MKRSRTHRSFAGIVNAWFLNPIGGKDRGFTLLELLVVIAIMAMMSPLVISAFSVSDSARGVDNAVHDIASALENARSYAKANNTYVWVGFFEEDGSKNSVYPATAGTGRIVMTIAASRDGTQGFTPDGTASNTNKLDPTRLIQVGKLIKVANVHLASFPDGTGTGSTFDSRAPAGVAPFPDNYGRIGGSYPPTPTQFPLQYPLGAGGSVPNAQYTFSKTIQFNPRGENVVNSNCALRPTVEIGLQPTHGALVDTNSKNVAAIQITGVTGNVIIYRR